jgi:hypothetical protein
MTAKSITARWERAAEVLHTGKLRYTGGGVKPLTFWLALAYVARGDCSAPELVIKMRISLSLASGMLRVMESQGLAQRSGKAGSNHRPRTLWEPTPKLLELMALEAAKPTTEAKA